MIGRLRGVLVSKEPTAVILDVRGVGYGLDIPVSTYERLSDVGGETTLFTHLIVRDDSIRLFGFASEDERDLFRLFLSVGGVGPRLALSLLSRSGCEELRRAIAESDLDSLTAVSGVGKKTAQRLVVELKDKMAAGMGVSDVPGSPVAADAVRALLSLGYGRQESVKSVRTAIERSGPGENVEELVRRALSVAGR